LRITKSTLEEKLGRAAQGGTGGEKKSQEQTFLFSREKKLGKRTISDPPMLQKASVETIGSPLA